MFDLRSLETFVWVARLGGFRAAADKLNTTQPAVSARIALLERDLGVLLFERRQRRSALTAKGIELLGYAERMLQLRAEMLRAVSGNATMRGPLRLGCSETVVHTWLARLVERIHADYPLIVLDIEVDTTPNLRHALLAHDLDIAFLLGPISEPRVVNLPLCSYPIAWVASPRLKLAQRRLGVAELARWPIISYPRDTRPNAEIKDLLARADLPEARVYGSSSIATIVRMTLDAIGVSAIPPVVIARELDEGNLEVLDTDCPLGDLGFTASYAIKPDSYMAAAVAELAVAIARAHGAEDRGTGAPRRQGRAKTQA